MQPRGDKVHGSAKILVCSGSEPVIRSLRTLLEPEHRVMIARNCRQAYRLLSQDRFDTVLCAEHLSDGDWEDILGVIATMPEPASVIVLSEETDYAQLSGEVSEMEGYGVLTTPLSEPDVERLIASAYEQKQRARKPAGRRAMAASAALA